MIEPFEDALEPLAAGALQAARWRGWKIATAESCTGGLIAAALTAVPGSSDVVERGFVTYSNTAKSSCLGVPVGLVQHHGAVSAEVAAAMAEGAVARSEADLAVAVTGVAGPGGGSADKPVGLVHVAVATRAGGVRSARVLRLGDIGRGAVRMATVETALAMLREVAEEG